MFFRLKRLTPSGKYTPAFVLIVLACAGFISAPVFSEQPAAVERPGTKVDENSKAALLYGPVQYPDLTQCQQLKDPSIYKGKRKILKYIHPGKDGWIFRSADFRTDFTLPDKTFDYMKQVNERLKAKGIDLVIVLQPPRAVLSQAQIDPDDMPDGYDPVVAEKNYKALIDELNQAGISAADLSGVPADVVYFFKGDPHWRREGAQWTAERVGKIIRKNPIYKDMKREEFSNEITWWLESEKGEFDEFVEQACGVVMPPERRPMWATTSLAGNVDEAALFGDVAYPDIAIVGTSNTAHEEDFNFVGSLKQVLKSDIRNRALSAGAFSGASLMFYATDEFHEHPPKILIWEFLSHHIFDDYIGFRQMLPAINGACSEEEALATASLSMTPPVSAESTEAAAVVEGAPVEKLPLKEYQVFEDLESRRIPGKGNYLYIEVTGPENRKLLVGVLYANGDADEANISRSRRAENNGKYYLQFNPDIDQDLLMIQIETEKPQGDIKARICKDSL